MKQCPKCLAKLTQNTIECEQCGLLLPDDFWNRGTISQESGESIFPSQSSDSEDLENIRPSTVHAVDGPGTLNVDPFDATEENDEVLSIELDDNLDDNQIGSTFQATDEVEKTHYYSTEGRDEISRTNIAADVDQNKTGSDLDNSRDQAGTARFTSVSSDRGSSDNTVGYDSNYPDRSTHEAGSSGSEGRFRRLWKGQIGSSQDPMHSLIDSGLEASDRIFERVVQRRVSDPNEIAGFDADYQLGKKLGEGAMGFVYSARQFALNRIVAFKTAKPQFQENDSARRQFLYEAQITAELDHSNIVPIYELGATKEGKLFYSMKLVDGTEWIKVMRQNSLERNLEIFMKVADAVAYAHAKGIIHRDLKPENTMLSRYGEVFVTDWGTAVNLTKMVTRLETVALVGERKLNVENANSFSAGDRIVIHDGESEIARCEVQRIDPINRNQLCLRKPIDCDLEPSPKLRIAKQFNPIAGTPCYMAPEMAEGRFAQIGKKCDIYVLGGILFDIITGRPPHVGKSKEECLFSALKNQIVKPKTSNPLLDIAYQALETDPKDRFPSIEAMQESIRKYQRNAESITISKQAAEHFQQAVASDDYELFNRSIFGYQNALDLWAENTTASTGLNEAHLEYIKSALKRGDFDLVIQTGNQLIDTEADLVTQAIKAKLVRDNRERSFKFLKSAATAVVLCSVIALSGLSVTTYRAYVSEQEARQEETRAKTAAETLAKTNGELAESNGELAESNGKLALENGVLLTTQIELTAKEKNDAEAISKLLEKEQKSLRDIEIALQKTELANQKSIESAKDARKAEGLANRRAAQVQLGEYAASLTLAKSRLDSFDIGSSRQILYQLKEPREELLKLYSDDQPSTTNWGWNRVSLLSNSDLKTVQLGGRPTAMDCATDQSTAVVASEDGRMFVLREKEGVLSVFLERPSDGSRIDAISLSPNAKLAVFASSRDGASRLISWDLDKDSLRELPESKQRAFQCVTFSKDSKNLLAGINGGVWVWQMDSTGIENWKLSGRTDSIRGQCESIQQLNDNQFLVGDRFEKNLIICILELSKSAESKPDLTIVPLDAELSSQSIAIAASEDGSHIYFGTVDDSIRIGRFDPSRKMITDLRVVETQHKAPVDRFVVGKGRLVSSSENEPIVHVWETRDGFRYDTHLAGTASNVQRVGLFSDSKVLLIDQQGTAIVLGIDRQKLRRRISSVTNSAPIVSVSAGSYDSDALAVDQNGVVDLWSLQDGQSSRVDSNHGSYFGHTPGASYVDSAVDNAKGFVVTSARLNRLTEEQKKYLVDPTHEWEFCVWDQKSGHMLRRWSEPNRKAGLDNRSESIEQRLSLVHRGLLFASDFETRLVDILSGRVTFQRSNFGAYIAVPNPKTPTRTMLVKRNGAVKLVDFDVPTTWDSKPNVDLTYNDDVPIKGQWSNDGERFYLLWVSGGLTVFEIDGNNILDLWSNRSEPNKSRLAQALSGNRPQSHCDVDLNIGADGEVDLVQIAVRDTTNQSTRHVSLRFQKSGIRTPMEVSEETAASIQWLDPNPEGRARLLNRVHDRFDVDPSRLRARNSVDGKTFVSISNAQVIAFQPSKTAFDSFGRAKLISVTGCNDGKRLFSLHEDGSVWSFKLEGEKGRWEKTSIHLPNAQAIYSSSNGSFLLVASEKKTTILDSQTGRVTKDFGEGSVGCWDVTRPERLVVCSRPGKVTLIEAGKETTIDDNVQLPENSKIVGLHFFREAWNETQKPSREFILIHVESSGSGLISFVPLIQSDDSKPADVTENSKKWSIVPSNCILATSPKDSVFLTGSDKGTIQLWIASPTWDPNSRALFELEGHRGSKITSLSFSSDGNTVISADDNRRLFAWLSVDPLSIGTRKK
jgi:serine/threonine protein kinase/WD40 repeat protein